MAAENIRLIVLAHTKFGENALALQTLSEAYGRRSFLVPVKALPEDVQDSMEAGMNEHLVKPFPPAELYRILQKYFA